MQKLTVKLLGMLLVATVAGVILFFLGQFAGRQLIRGVYMAPARVEARVNAGIRNFREYVEVQGLASTDAQAVGQWTREHPALELSINGRNTILNSDGTRTEITQSDSGLSLRLEGSNQFDFAVNFTDGTYTVSVADHSEDRLYTLTEVAAVVLSAVVFLLIMVLYERHVTTSVLRLSSQVRQVSRGDLALQIHAPSQDEIGQLAGDVEAMRLGLIDQLRREEDAWKANADLITAISHDVRTPLTALLGYLDVLDDPQLPPEARQAYLQVCRRHALRLKDLTDELFGFFLVFGKRTPEQKLEDFDAPTLIGQLLLEGVERLRQQGLQVQLAIQPDMEGNLLVDAGHLHRVFENLFSNLRKYADPAQPVTVTAGSLDGKLEITMVNAIAGGAGRVESNRIGLKTCQKLMDAMAGSFFQEQDGKNFTVRLELPLQ